MNEQLSLFPLEKTDAKINARSSVKERLERYGSTILLNHEILALLLGIDFNKAEDICSKYTLQELNAILDDSRLQLTEAQTQKLKMLYEFCKRINTLNKNKAIIKSPEDVSRLLMEELRYLNKEHFFVLLLNTKNHLLRKELISVGSLNSSIVHPREVFNMAIKVSCSSMILVHQHPSGDPEPSREDIETTEKLINAGNILGIKVLDHIIIGDGRYVSFKEQGLM